MSKKMLDERPNHVGPEWMSHSAASVLFWDYNICSLRLNTFGKYGTSKKSLF